MRRTKAAGRYAQSLIGLAIERGELDQVKADMELIAKICAESHELDLLLQSPIIKTDQKQKALKTIFEKAVSNLTRIAYKQRKRRANCRRCFFIQRIIQRAHGNCNR